MKTNVSKMHKITITTKETIMITATTKKSDDEIKKASELRKGIKKK